MATSAGDLNDIAKVHFHDLPTPEFDSPSPDFNALSKFPSHLQPSWDASMLLREPIASFLRNISSKAKRVIVVHDPLMSYNAQDVSSLPNVESYVPSLEGIMADKARDFSTYQHQYMDIRSGDIHNTSKVIEGKLLDLLEQAETNLNKKKWAIGPVLPTKLDHISNRNDICLEWLNKQPPR
ncbi:zeatin O-glucosyltransferase-like [Solanum tuberosum]|uniref:zeatin O-glucosyltransferase-like n=1 Tax=Solanum tuberosum TaxID=4113 RepID=UPI000739FAF5|nr:PREDICTED: zeatin O-glucosyltransferase-like [Solanum tuberosum]